METERLSAKGLEAQSENYENLERKQSILHETKVITKPLHNPPNVSIIFLHYISRLGADLFRRRAALIIRHK